MQEKELGFLENVMNSLSEHDALSEFNNTHYV